MVKSSLRSSLEATQAEEPLGADSSSSTSGRGEFKEAVSESRRGRKRAATTPLGDRGYQYSPQMYRDPSNTVFPAPVASAALSPRRMERFIKQQLSGWGRFPVETCYVCQPADAAELGATLDAQLHAPYIARGLGRSYGDTALNQGGGVISNLRLDRVHSFDPSTGVLSCEAGLSLARIIELFLPRGFFLPVSPGTKFVTVGGAIANDIHGKNHHHEGSISNFILDLTLLTPRGEVLTCSPTQNEDIFWATVGGIGLTGVILDARVQLKPVDSAYVSVDYRKARDLDHALSLFSSSDDDQYQYSVAWIDCLARGRSLGRAVLMRGNHARAADLPAGLPPGLDDHRSRRQWGVPFDLPALALNRFTVRAFNQVFYALHRDSSDQIVSLEKYFYPLDAINWWNRLYGRRGFVQYQAVFPPASSREGLLSLLSRLSGAGRASFLAVLKRFGEGGRGLLSFPVEGYTLALDMPVTTDLRPFMRGLDELVLRYGGRVYLAKDSTLEPDIFREMYPRLSQFQAVRQGLDPHGLLSSSMARRLGIVG